MNLVVLKLHDKMLVDYLDVAHRNLFDDQMNALEDLKMFDELHRMFCKWCLVKEEYRVTFQYALNYYYYQW
jgi:predicted transcriptional regulator